MSDTFKQSPDFQLSIGPTNSSSLCEICFMASASDSTATSYDRVPYKSHPFRQSHPDRLAVIATLHGMLPTPIERARVLELGCASGGNLVPMADQFPEATFRGLDMSIR